VSLIIQLALCFKIIVTEIKKQIIYCFTYKKLNLMRYLLAIVFIHLIITGKAQTYLDTSAYNTAGEAKISVNNNVITATWLTGKSETGKLLLDLSKGKPLFKSIQLNGKEVMSALDPAFILTIGKRDLVSQNGWNIFLIKCR
jgi:hypothetical protein